MGRSHRIAAPLAVVALLAGVTSACSALDSGGAPPGDEESAGVVRAESAKPARDRTWEGAQAANYDHSYRICSVFTVREIARDMNVRAKPKAAARAHARELYGAQYRRAAYEGCLDAFQGRPPGVR
jgi:hypothetical protein